MASIIIRLVFKKKSMALLFDFIIVYLRKPKQQNNCILYKINYSGGNNVKWR